MKTVSAIIFLLYLSIACSPEGTESTKAGGINTVPLKEGVNMPNNPDNSQDYIGVIYTNLLDSYYQSAAANPSLQQVLSQGESFALLNPGFQSLVTSNGYSPVTISQIQPYLQGQSGDIAPLLVPDYSAGSVEILRSIANNLKELKQLDASYQKVYDSLLDVETATINETGISTAERYGILTTAAILRNALYHDTRRKRRDRDWEWMMPNVAATANLALESRAEAIIIAFATDVYMQ